MALRSAGDTLVDVCNDCHDVFKPGIPTEGILLKRGHVSNDERGRAVDGSDQTGAATAETAEQLSLVEAVARAHVPRNRTCQRGSVEEWGGIAC
jgi:hypothetical protein